MDKKAITGSLIIGQEEESISFSLDRLISMSTYVFQNHPQMAKNIFGQKYFTNHIALNI